MKVYVKDNDWTRLHKINNCVVVAVGGSAGYEIIGCNGLCYASERSVTVVPKEIENESDEFIKLYLAL